MKSEFTFPYRRFSGEMYASSLLSLLDEHTIPFEIVTEPEGIGAVFLGESGLPGIIVMVREEDSKRIFELEKNERPVSKEENERLQDEEESLSAGWIGFWYVFALFGSPIAMIAGIQIMTSKARTKNYSRRFTYDAATRRQGKFIFIFAVFMLAFGIARMTTRPGGSLLDMFSFLVSCLVPHHL